MRVVFDTNVLYSALAAKGFCEEVLDEAAGDCVIICSQAMQEELERVLTRRHKIGPATRAALAAYVELSEFLEPERLPNGSAGIRTMIWFWEPLSRAERKLLSPGTTIC